VKYTGTGNWKSVRGYDAFMEYAKTRSDLNYDNFEYVTMNVPSTVMCTTCSNIFKTTAGNNMVGKGCAKCAGLVKCTTKEAIASFDKVHKGKYTYTDTVYVDAKTKVDVICKEHGKFTITPNNHKRGRGCPKCIGRDNDMVYIWRVVGTDIYKIGCSSIRKGTQRIDKVAQILKVEHELIYLQETEKALEIEKHLLDTYKVCPTVVYNVSGCSEFRVMSLADIAEAINYIKDNR